jgi:hypothetical protein
MVERFYVPHKVETPAVQVNIRVGAEWRAKVDRYCALHGCTIKDLVVTAVEYAMQNTKPPK